MLIGFIGTPSSGKTTLAAETFVHLKRMGVVSEFVVEIARQHIAQKRLEGKQTLQGNVVLTDDDQQQIMEKQLLAEELMNTPDTICVSDSSPLNAIMYMSDAVRLSDAVKKMFIQAIFNYDLLILAEDIQESYAPDPNRLHGLEHRAGLQAQRHQLVQAIMDFRPDLQLISARLDEPEVSRLISYAAVDKFHLKKTP